MKHHLMQSKCWVPAGGIAAVALCSAFLGGGSKPGFTAHEWGTFTSVQGGDGVLLDWRPLETSRLPGFVYDWTHPGLNRVAGGPGLFSKSVVRTLQRMETPVIYFYADRSQEVDVSVKFPQGTITEWFPQAAQIGPSIFQPPPAVTRLDGYAHQVGAAPGFTFASVLANASLPDSRVHWAHVAILGKNKRPALLSDRSGSHYFAARDTDANYLRVHSFAATNPLPENEKFIFYRGLGNFVTPLSVTLTGANTLKLANTAAEPLASLFILEVENGSGRFQPLDRLAPGEQRAIPLNREAPAQPLNKLSQDLCQRVAAALVAQGLYRREATAMVNTWKDSWFAEDGLRVLYLLPRAWTDRTLPMTLEPAPRELVRVMVGRAEVLTPAREQQLTDNLTKASRGDIQARGQALAEVRRLGRFAEPALVLASKGSSPETSQTMWALLQQARNPN